MEKYYNIINIKAVFTALVFCISYSSFFSACSGYSPYTVLSELRDSLKTTNDTISLYCIKEKYAIWIHSEPDSEFETRQTLYYYDLESRERMKVFTTFEDSLNIIPWNMSSQMATITDIMPSNDSLAILIYDIDASTYMLPINNIKSKSRELIHLGNARNNTGIPERNGNLDYAASEGEYYVEDWVRFPEEYNWVPGSVLKKDIYNTSGEFLRTTPMLKIYADNRETQKEVSSDLLTDKDEILKELIRYVSYDMKELRNISNNSILFKETFESQFEEHNLKSFALTLNSVEEAFNLGQRDSSGEQLLRVKGEDFYINTRDNSFARLQYPCRVIIRAKVKDASNELNNPYAMLLGGLFGIDNSSIRFIFTDAELLYAADQNN